MASCGPFEPQPVIAVGVSGGGDSLALLMLAQNWATERGGGVVALSVDHRLRMAAADELRHVRVVCAGLGIRHRILTWHHEGVTAALQASARRARYDLMAGWCRAEGVLHLAVAHTADDQAETQAMRAERAPAGRGVAGMAMVRLEQGVRLIRPLLGQSGKGLRHYLQELGTGWVEDPSNQDRRFERVRQRQQGSLAGPDTGGIAERIRQDREIAALAARAVSLSPAGYALVSRAELLSETGTGVALIGHLLRTLSGSSYGPATEKTENLLARLADRQSGAMTLGGCLLQLDDDRILVVREHQRCRSVSVEEALADGWDNRFCVQAGKKNRHHGAVIGPAGKSTDTLRPLVRSTGLPLAVIRGLPAMFVAGEFAGLLSWHPSFQGIADITARFASINPLVPSARWLVPRGMTPILELANRS